MCTRTSARLCCVYYSVTCCPYCRCSTGLWSWPHPVHCLHRKHRQYLYASATIEKRRRRHTLFGSVRPWVRKGVSLCVPKTLWSPYLKNRWREFRPILVTDVFGFIDVLVSSCGQKAKGQGHRKQWPEKPGEYNIFLNIFTKIGSCMYLRLRHTHQVKMSRSQQAEA